MREEIHSFSSSALGNSRDIWIRRPKEIGAKTNILLILDAELYRDRVKAPEIIEERYQKQSADEPLVIYVSHCDRDVRWIECPCHPPFLTFIVEELYPWIVERFPSVCKSADRVIAGLSYTGLAASYVALNSGGIFTKVISQSGSYWSDDCRLISEYEISQNKSDIAFFLDVGDQETEVNVQHKEDVFQKESQIECVERFRDVLIRKGHEVRYEVFKGGHSCEGWASTLPDAVEWAFHPSAEATAEPEMKLHAYKNNHGCEFHDDGQPELMTVAEAGNYVGLGRKGIYPLIQMGFLPGFCGPGHFRVSRMFLDTELLPALKEAAKGYSNSKLWLEEQIKERDGRF